MFELTVNLYESILIFTFLFFMPFFRKNGKSGVIYLLLFIMASFILISFINQYSPSESLLTLLFYLIRYIFISLISDDSAARKFFIISIPDSIIGIENICLLIFGSYLTLHTVDYEIFMDRYRIVIVIIAQILHTLTLYYIYLCNEPMKLIVKDQDYLLLAASFLVSNILTVCFESVILDSERYVLFMVLGIALTIVLTFLILFLFRSLYYHSAVENRQQLELAMLRNQQSSNEKVLKAQAELLQLRHDMKHFIELIRQSDIDSIQKEEILKDYQDKVLSSPIPITTRSKPVNYAINIKREEALKKDIQFITKLNIPHDIAMEDPDLYLLLSNLLDNAINHIGIGKKIEVEMHDINDSTFMIKVANSIDHSVLNSNNQFYALQNKDGHGFGIKTIAYLMDMYDGTVSYMEDNHMLIAAVMFPNSREK